MKIEEADELFTLQGYRRRMVPTLVVMSLAFVGLAMISSTVQSDPYGSIPVLVGVFAFVFGSQSIRYCLAGKKHNALKQLYGARYISLVEEGKIPIDPTSVLMGAPWFQARRHIPEEGPRIPPPDPL